MRNDQVLQIRLPTGLKELAHERAERDGINLSEFIRGVLEQYIEEGEDDDEQDVG